MIRRMRTAFRPNKDASYLVRKQNQKKLAEYLRNRPFGEGLGLGGVEARRFGSRLTTTIPTTPPTSRYGRKRALWAFSFTY